MKTRTRSPDELAAIDRVIGWCLKGAAVLLTLLLFAFLALPFVGCSGAGENAEDVQFISFEPTSVRFETDAHVELIGGVEHRADICFDFAGLLRIRSVPFPIPMATRACYITMPATGKVQHCSWLRFSALGFGGEGAIEPVGTAECTEVLGGFEFNAGAVMRAPPESEYEPLGK